MFAPSGALLIGAGEKVVRPHADALAGNDVHAIVDHRAGTLGDVILGDGRNHRRFFPGIQRGYRDLAHRIAGIQMPGHSRQRRLHAFELADGQAELLAHRRIGTGAAYRDLAQADVGRWQRDRPPGGQALHQHAPAIADLVAAADHPLQRNEDVLALGRTVLEHRVERPMPATGLYTRVRGGNQRAGDTQATLAAQQALRIFGTKRQAEYRRDRTQGDIALVPGDPETQHFLTVELPFADHADIRDGPGIGAGVGAGQGETRNILG